MCPVAESVKHCETVSLNNEILNLSALEQHVIQILFDRARWCSLTRGFGGRLAAARLVLHGGYCSTSDAITTINVVMAYSLSCLCMALEPLQQTVHVCRACFSNDSGSLCSSCPYGRHSVTSSFLDHTCSVCIVNRFSEPAWSSFSLCAASSHQILYRDPYVAQYDDHNPLLRAERNPNKVVSAEVCTGANIFTNGSDPPLKPDEEYPEWLWELTKPLKTSKQLQQQVCFGTAIVQCITYAA